MARTIGAGQTAAGQYRRVGDLRLFASHSVRDGRELRLYAGDLSAIPMAEAVDLLMVSAFPNNYAPTQTSLIGALHRRGISVAALANDKEADLRASFSCWLSRDLSVRAPSAGFNRLLCFESALRGPPEEIVGDVFRAVLPFAFDPPIRSIAMPLLATGDQRGEPEAMLRAIFAAATHWLGAGLPIDVVKLVVRTEEAARHLAGVFTDLVEQRNVPQRSHAGRSSLSPYDYFVSYAHADATDVENLIHSLQAHRPRARIFLDKHALEPGHSWQAELDAALESCRNVIALYSPAYLASKVCIEEFNMARIRHRESDTGILRPIYLRSAALPLYMRSLQYIDCREANKAHYSQAAHTLAAFA